MNPTFSRHTILTLLYFLVGLPFVTFGQDVKSYQCRIGTMEVVGEKYIFRWGKDEEEVFDRSLLGIAAGTGEFRTGRGWSGPTGLGLIGFGSNGAFYKLGHGGSGFEKFKKEHPNGEIDTYVLLGDGDHRIEIKAKGQTPICRIDITFTNGSSIVLWSNIPDVQKR